MREPGFWHRPRSLSSSLLMPVAAAYGAISGARMSQAGSRADVPVICVGNYHMGGAGKTPVTLALVEMLRAAGEQPFVLSRGYGGKLAGPVRVNPATHAAADVGDEPLMMSRHVPVIVARGRVAGAALACENSASVIVMDDGFQNPSVHKDASVIVIDGQRGLGNGCVFPAGPLRAPLAPQLVRTDALIVVGDGTSADDVAAQVKASGGLVLRARAVPDEASLASLQGKPVLAFAGIGNPERFFATLRDGGIDVAQTRSFADHHPFSRSEIESLAAEAQRNGLTLVTTEKDRARLGAAGQGIATLGISVIFDRPDDLKQLVTDRLARRRAAAS